VVLDAPLDMDEHPRTGRWTSPEVAAAFPFTELIPSWNAATPPGTGVEFEARTRDAATGEWSPWLYYGQWGRTLHPPERTVRFGGGTVHTDVLQLEAPATAFQLRAQFSDFRLEAGDPPSVRRLAACYSGVVADEAERARLSPPRPIRGEWARDLGVPFHAQGLAPASIKGSICSATSVTMVAEHHGAARPVVENALAIYDMENGIFGNWSRATQRAAELGLEAWVGRVRSWEDAKSYIAEGTPLIATIRFEKGTFPSSVLEGTSGHLIVIRGLTPEGDAIVNDPASRDRGDGVVYKADELARAWFGRGGVTYIIRKPR